MAFKNKFNSEEPIYVGRARDPGQNQELERANVERVAALVSRPYVKAHL